MNESDYLRGQLAAERAHLRELLAPATGPAHTPAAGEYLAWAAPRLLAACGRHLELLPGRLAARQQTLPPQSLARIGTATRDVSAALTQLQAALDGDRARLPQALAAQTPPLTALLNACEDELEPLAAACYRVEDWRQAARLRADDVLRERQLYAAARA